MLSKTYVAYAYSICMEIDSTWSGKFGFDENANKPTITEQNKHNNLPSEKQSGSHKQVDWQVLEKNRPYLLNKLLQMQPPFTQLLNNNSIMINTKTALLPDSPTCFLTL